MNKKDKPTELSYYGLYLLSHLKENHPDKAHDAAFARHSTDRFNRAFAPNRTKYDWLSRDNQFIDQYQNDPLCGFDLTVSGYCVILQLQEQILNGIAVSPAIFQFC